MNEENSFASGMRVGSILNHLNLSRVHSARSRLSQPQSLHLNKSYKEHICFLRERIKAMMKNKKRAVTMTGDKEARGGVREGMKKRCE